MGLLDSVIGGLLGGGGNQQQSSGMGSVLSGLLGGGGQQQGGMAGGLGGLMSQFQNAGLGHIAQSWVGGGANQSVSPDQLQSVFGQGQVQQMASQAGMQPQDFLSQLAQHLPNAVDQMTPNGQASGNEGTVSV